MVFPNISNHYVGNSCWSNEHFRTHNDNYDNLNKKLFAKITGVARKYKPLNEMMTIEVVNYPSVSIICK